MKTAFERGALRDVRQELAEYGARVEALEDGGYLVVERDLMGGGTTTRRFSGMVGLIDAYRHQFLSQRLRGLYL